MIYSEPDDDWIFDIFFMKLCTTKFFTKYIKISINHNLIISHVAL